MPNAIALIPGFLGFDHVAGFSYFADRFCAGLRMQVQELSGEQVEILPLPIPPVGSLADRQESVLGRLKELEKDAAYKNARWHLVGHSAGGVDAAMLACTHRLESDDTSSRFSSRRFAAGGPKIRSVTTLASPHYGSCITMAPVTEMTGDHQWSWEGAKELGRVGLDAVWNRHGGDRFEMALANMTEAGHPLHFLYHLLRDDALIRDLNPEVMTMLTGQADYRRDARIRSIATIVPRPNGKTTDRLFRDLWHLTQERAGHAPSAPSLAKAGKPVIKNAKCPAIAGGKPLSTDSDGVVNTDRQVLPGTFAGLVYGDHGDVMGRYQRRAHFDAKSGLLDPGLLTSGAHFGDNEFFDLIGLIAAEIAKAV